MKPTLKNTPERYGSVAQFFHWTTFLGVLAAYVTIYYALWFLGSNKNPLCLPDVHLHWALGLLIGAITIPRIIWRIRQPLPEDVPGTPLEHWLAHWVHRLFYVILFLMPVTGYLGTRVGTDFGF